MQMSLAITKKWRAIPSILEVQAELILKVDCFSKFSIRRQLLKYSLCTELFPTWGDSLIHMHDGSLARDAICRSASHLHSLWSGEHRRGGSAGRKHAADFSWASKGTKYLWNKASQIESRQNKDTIEAKCGSLSLPPSAHEPLQSQENPPPPALLWDYSPWKQLQNQIYTEGWALP